MASLESTPRYTCCICGKHVLLETCKTDDRGRMVHESCYSLRLTVQSEAVLEGTPHQLFLGRRRSWKEIAKEVLGEKDRGRFGELTEELYEALVAQELGIQWQGPLAEDNLHVVPKTIQRFAFEKIVDNAVALMRSDYASLQMLYPERGTGGELRLLAFQGFNPRAASFWEWVRADSQSTCGIALRDMRRVVAPEIATCDFMADSEDQLVYLQTGILACQTTPLITRTGNVVGMISTHWRTPHQPSETDFRQFDTLAQQAAEVIELCKREEKW
jgi:GAF domain-containing protein